LDGFFSRTHVSKPRQLRKLPNIPLVDSSSFKKAVKEKVGEQDKLF
jgi:hypothetical protein